MKKCCIAGLMSLAAFGVCAESVPGSLNYKNGMAAIHGAASTNAGIHAGAGSTQHLRKVNLEDGSVIISAGDSPSANAQPLTAAGGSFVAEGSGRTNRSQRLSGPVYSSIQPNAGTNALGEVVQDPRLSGKLLKETVEKPE